MSSRSKKSRPRRPRLQVISLRPNHAFRDHRSGVRARLRVPSPTSAARLLTVDHVFRDYGIGIDSLRRLIARRQLRTVHLPGIRRTLIDRVDLDAAISGWKNGGLV